MAKKRPQPQDRRSGSTARPTGGTSQAVGAAFFRGSPPATGPGRPPVSAGDQAPGSERPDAGRRPQAPPRRRAAATPLTPVRGANAAPTPTTLPPVPRPALAVTSGEPPVEVTSFTCSGLDQADPRALGVTYWFDAAPDGEPYPVAVHLGGRLRGEPPPGGAATFSRISTVDRVVPGSGRVSLTTRIPDLPPGTWDVTATPVRRARSGAAAGQWVAVKDPRLPAGTATGTTGFAPVIRVRAPGVRLGAWPTMVAAGAVLGIALQGVLATRVGLPVSRVLWLTVLASVLGLLGAKAYHLATHPRELRSVLTSGMSVQGFVITVVVSLLAGSAVLDLPVGSLLDVSSPGLLVGLAVGRLGCLVGGCCAGRPTASRWGLWSSDRRIGVRRIPVQLMESSLAAVLALLTLAGVLTFGAGGGGMVFVVGIAAYVVGRQLLFPLRGLPRATRHGRVVTLTIAAAVAVGALTALLV